MFTFNYLPVLLYSSSYYYRGKGFPSSASRRQSVRKHDKVVPHLKGMINYKLYSMRWWLIEHDDGDDDDNDAYDGDDDCNNK